MAYCVVDRCAHVHTCMGPLGQHLELELMLTHSRGLLQQCLECSQAVCWAVSQHDVVHPACPCSQSDLVRSSRGGKAGSHTRSVRSGCSGGASSMCLHSPTTTYSLRPASSPAQGPPMPQALQLQLSKLHQWVRCRWYPWCGQVWCLWPTILSLVREPQTTHYLRWHRRWSFS
jgi:hypothetical protein